MICNIIDITTLLSILNYNYKLCSEVIQCYISIILTFENNLKTLKYHEPFILTDFNPMKFRRYNRVYKLQI